MSKSKSSPPPTVEEILEECTDEVRRGLGKKKVTKAAKDFWIEEHRASITKQLKHGGVWDKDKKNVLPTARKMGKIAAILAGDGMVLKWAAEASHEAVKRDPRCPNVGSGGYCDF